MIAAIDYKAKREKMHHEGGNAPYALTFLCNCYASGVTATEKIYGGKASIIIRALSHQTKLEAGKVFPLMGTDSTGIGRSFNIVIVDKKADDSVDTPDCNYAYLPRSVSYLPESGTLQRMIEAAGFRRVVKHKLSGGVTQRKSMVSPWPSRIRPRASPAHLPFPAVEPRFDSARP